MIFNNIKSCFLIYNRTKEIMWFVIALIGIIGYMILAQLINKNSVLQYWRRISLIVLCLHCPIYWIVIKVISMMLHTNTNLIRANFSLAILVVVITMIVCSIAYEVIIRIIPWMIEKKLITEWSKYIFKSIILLHS